MRVFVTGGAGFIGSRLAARLLADGHDVVCLDSLHPQVHQRPGRPSDLPDDALLVPVDVSDRAQVDRALLLAGAPDVVVHLAAETGTGQSLTEASRHARANVVGTTEVLDALTRAGVVPQRIVLTSSRAVYGEGKWVAEADGSEFYPGPRTAAQLAAGEWDAVAPDGGPARPVPHEAATVWPRPTNVYAATKLAQEHVLGAWCAAFGTALSVLRLQNVYGPGQAVGNAYTGVLTFFARRLAEGRAVDVFEDGRIIRDFVFITDVVDALAMAIAAGVDQPLLLDIGCGQPATLLDVATTMSTIARAPAPAVVGTYRLGDVRAASANVGAATKALGWVPSTSLADGLAQLLRWVHRQLEDPGSTIVERG